MIELLLLCLLLLLLAHIHNHSPHYSCSYWAHKNQSSFQHHATIYYYYYYYYYCYCCYYYYYCCCYCCCPYCRLYLNLCLHYYGCCVMIWYRSGGHLAETCGLYLDIGNPNTDVCPDHYFPSPSLHLHTSC
jgi:hypothetical protein